MKQILIGLTGTKPELNNAVAAHLHAAHGLEIVRIATPFEEAAAAMIGKAGDFIRNASNAPRPILDTLPMASNAWDHPPSVRSTVHALRTHFAHSLHAEFLPCLLESTLQQLADIMSDIPGFVIPDLLFANEGRFIRAHDGLVIHLLSAPDANAAHWPYFGKAPVSRDASDYSILHHGTMRDVLDSVDNIIASQRAAETEWSPA